MVRGLGRFAAGLPFALLAHRPVLRLVGDSEAPVHGRDEKVHLGGGERGSFRGKRHSGHAENRPAAGWNSKPDSLK